MPTLVRRLATKYGKTDIHGAKYEDLIGEVIAYNTRKVQTQLYDNETKRTKETARLRSPTGKRVVLPPLEEVMTPEAVRVRKAADSGKVITDTLRQRLSDNLRTALMARRESGKPLYVQGQGAEAGRLDQEVVREFEALITQTFSTYCRRTKNLAGGFDPPGNLHEIAVTEVGAAVDELKNAYTKRILALNDDLEATKKWHQYTRLSKEARPHHGVVNGQEIPIDQPFPVPLYVKRRGEWIDTGIVTYMQYPHDGQAPASQVVSCIPGDSVIAAKGVEAVMKSLFDGLLVTVRTKNGLEFSATANHPVLTDKGWIEAQSLEVGRNIISVDRGKAIERREQYINNRPATIGEIFNLPWIAGLLPLERITSTYGKFHGERKQRKIDIKSVYGELWNRRKSSFLEHLEEFGFSSALSRFFILAAPSFFAKSIIILFRSTRDGISSFCERFFLFHRKAIHSYRVRFFRRSNMDPSLNQDLSDPIASSDIKFCQRVFGHSALISLDEIVDVNIEQYSGQVFNLSTISGIYGTSRNDTVTRFAVVHNCHCGVEYRLRRKPIPAQVDVASAQG